MFLAGDAPARDRGCRTVARALGGLLALLGAALFACKAPDATSSPVEESLRPAVRSGSVSIPAGAGSELAKSKPVLFLGVESIDACPDAIYRLSDQSLQVARTEIEALLPRMKRFTVYSVFNDGGRRVARKLSDSGQMEDFDPERLPAPDVTLNVKVTLNAQVQPNPGAESTIDYTLTAIYALTDKSGKILEDAPDASGTIRSPATTNPDRMTLGRRKFVQEYNPDTGKREWAGGFNPRDPESSAAVLRNLMADIDTGLAAKLAIALPLTTKVTGISGSRTKFSIGAGQKDGVFKGTKVVVWLSDGDFAYALANTVAEPTAKGANLEVVEWNQTDPDAKPFVDQIKASGIDAVKDRLFATTADIPIREMLSPAVGQ